MLEKEFSTFRDINGSMRNSYQRISLSTRLTFRVRFLYDEYNIKTNAN